MPINAHVTVTGPTRAPHRFGLFSAVPVVDLTDPHAQMGVQWEPLTCARPKVVGDGCPCPPNKEFEPAPGVHQAEPFVVMGSWACGLPGNSIAEAQRRARRHLELGEQHAVEWAVWTGDASAAPWFAHESTPTLGTVHCATDLLATVEAHAASHYVGAPLLHLPRSVVPYLDADGLLTTVSGQRLETRYGTPVIAGAGYTEANTGPGGVPAPAGAFWVYATGAMQIWRGPVITPPDPTAGFSRCNNDFVALAERIYLVGWDCFTAAVLFEPCCDCGPPTPPPPPAPAAQLVASPAGESTEEGQS